MKKWHLFVFFVIAQICCFPQYDSQISQSLQNVKEASYYDSTRLFESGKKAELLIKQKGDEKALAELHLYYGNYFFYIRNLNKATSYFEQALNEARASQNKTIETLAHIRLAYIQFENGNHDKAEKEMSALLTQTKRENDFVNTAEVLNLLGIIKEQKNQTQDAAKLYLEGISLAETHKLNYYSGVFRNNLGLIKYYSGRNKEALEDYGKGLEFAIRDNNQRLASHIQMNRCVVYVNQKEFKKAEGLFAEVTAYSKKNNLPQELASVYINLASSFLGVNKQDVAMQYFDSAIHVLENHHLLKELTRAYLGKCEANIQLKKFKDATEILARIKKLNDETKSLEDESSYYYLLFRIKQESKNDKEALAAYLMHTKLKDSLSAIMNGKIIEELQVKYDVQKKEIDLVKEKSKTILLEKSNQEERYMKWLAILIGSAILVLVISFSLIVYSRKVREKQEQFSRQLINQIEEERHRIARDLHDDIGQSLSIIKSLAVVNGEVKTESDKKLESELSRVIEQTRQISRTLYPSYLEKIGLVRAAAALAESIQSATGIQCSCEITDKADALPIDVRTHLYRIMQECTNNTIKHSGATALKIFIEENKGEFVMQYKDNGKGFSQKRNSGIGLQSMQERAKIIGGSINFVEKAEKGFELVLKFKNAIS